MSCIGFELIRSYHTQFWNRLTQCPGLGLVFLVSIRQPYVCYYKGLRLFQVYYQRLGRGPQDAQNLIGLTIQNTCPIAFVGLLNSIAIYPRDKLLFLHGEQHPPT
jgi:hypothetical protein